MSTDTLERTDVEIDPTTGEPRCSHIVKQQPGKTAQAIVMEAMVNGTPVTALCGHTWVPGRDPKRYPVCSKCVEIADEIIDPNLGGSGDID